MSLNIYVSLKSILFFLYVCVKLYVNMILKNAISFLHFFLLYAVIV